MAGQPKFRAFCERIEAEGGDDVILDRIATGETLRLITADYGCSERQLYHWRDQNKQRKAAWKEARKIAAHRMAEDALEILDEGKPKTSADATMLKSRAEHRKWLAEIWNKEEYGGDKQTVDVNLNIGELFLESLQASNRPRITAPPVEIPEAEVEFLPDDEGTETLPDDEGTEDELYGLVDS